MTLLEQIAMFLLSFGHALRETRRPAAWAPWLLVLGASLVALAAISWAAHPLVSPLVAPLLRASAGEDALRYPGLFHRLPVILADVRFALDAVFVPVAFGGSAIAFAARYRGQGVPADQVLRLMLKLAPVFVIAALPAWLAEAGLRAGLAALPGIRLSGVSRTLAAPAAGALLVMIRAAFLCSVVHAAVARRGPWAAIASVPGAFRDSFVPGLLVLVVLGVPLALFDTVSGSGPLAAFTARVPEGALVFAGARAALAAAAGVVATGTATLVWLGARSQQERE